MTVYALDDPRFVPMQIRSEPEPAPRKTLHIPDHVDPAVRTLLEHVVKSDVSWIRLEAQAEVGVSTIRRWAYRENGPTVRGPGINYVRRALRAIGLDLAVVPYVYDDAPTPDVAPVQASGRTCG